MRSLLIILDSGLCSKHRDKLYSVQSTTYITLFLDIYAMRIVIVSFDMEAVWDFVRGQDGAPIPASGYHVIHGSALPLSTSLLQT